MNSESYIKNEGSEIPNSVAVGRYVLDLHGADETPQLEEEFGETNESIAKNKPFGPFQHPLKSLYPRIWTVFGGGKNLSMTRLASWSA